MTPYLPAAQAAYTSSPVSYLLPTCILLLSCSRSCAVKTFVNAHALLTRTASRPCCRTPRTASTTRVAIRPVNFTHNVFTLDLTSVLPMLLVPARGNVPAMLHIKQLKRMLQAYARAVTLHHVVLQVCTNRALQANQGTYSTRRNACIMASFRLFLLRIHIAQLIKLHTSKAGKS